MTTGRIQVDNITTWEGIIAQNETTILRTQTTTCRGNLPLLFRERQYFLRALIQVALMIGDLSSCTRFHRVLSH